MDKKKNVINTILAAAHDISQALHQIIKNLSKLSQVNSENPSFNLGYYNTMCNKTVMYPQPQASAPHLCKTIIIIISFRKPN